MADDLSGDRPRRIHFDAHVRHLEDREVTMLQTILKKLRGAIVILLVLWG